MLTNDGINGVAPYSVIPQLFPLALAASPTRSARHRAPYTAHRRTRGSARGCWVREARCAAGGARNRLAARPHAAARSKSAEAKFGAGIVAGASDNDPTTVATLAVIGSTTTYELGWLTLLVIPMLAVIQAIAAQVGTVSKKGLEDCVRSAYGRFWAVVALAALLIVNVLTLAADLEGGAAAMDLLTGIELPLVGGAARRAHRDRARVRATTARIERVLRYIALLFLTYVGAAFLAHPDWGAVFRGSFVPHFDLRPDTVSGALALLGTTLTAYAYVWETIELSEEKPKLRRWGSCRSTPRSASSSRG